MAEHTALRVAVIGAGDISRYHLAAWRKIADVEIVAVCDIDPERARQRAAEFGVARAVSDFEGLLAEERLHAVDIVTWRDSHVALCLQAANLGIDVMCQKPLAPTLREAEELVAAVAGNARLMVHENRRFAPHYRTVRGWVEAGELGEFRHGAMSTYRSSLRPDADGRRPNVERAPYYSWESRLLVGEALIHQLDLLRYLLGPLSVVAARTLRTEAELPGETVATILMEVVANGAPVVLSGSYVDPIMVTDGDSESAMGLGPTEERLELFGSDASVLLSDRKAELRGPHPQSVAVDALSSFQSCFDSAVQHFVSALRAGTAFETDARDNLETLRLVEDVYRHARLGTTAARLP